MRVKVNLERCEANRICVDISPELFAVDAADKLHVLQAEVPEALRAKVEEAVQSCPRNALSIEE